MKRLTMAVVVAVVVLGCGYVAHAIHETVTEGTKPAIPGDDAGKLYFYITKPKPYYDKWKLCPGTGRFLASEEPHGAFVTIYLNDIAQGAIKNPEGMADGSIIVSENYTADKKLDSLSVMYKIKGYNTERGDWFWVKYSGDSGYVQESGKVEACITCHGSRKDKDYLHCAR